MKRLDSFLLKDMLKAFVNCEVGFVIEGYPTYKDAMASVRIRCYDVINYLEKKGIKAELYKPYKNYKIVLFTKAQNDRAIKIARKLKQKGTIVYYESYCDGIDDDSVKSDAKECVKEMLKLTDIAGVASEVHRESYSNVHSNVVMIPESVPDTFFGYRKKHINDKRPTLVYCGYSDKARDLLCIEDVIVKLQKERNCELIIISEKDPKIKEFEYRFIVYEQDKIAQLFLEGDIMVAPRPLQGIEKRGHSFTKASYPLAVGLPTVASPMPSYLNTPVVVCNNNQEWYETLCDLLDNPQKRNELGNEGIQYIRNHYSMDVVGKEYLKILSEAGIEIV